MSRRVRGEERKGKEGLWAGWDGRAVECRKETAPGLWHGSGAAEKGHLAYAKAAGEGAKTKTKTKTGLRVI